MLRKPLLATVALLALSVPTKAAVIKNLGVNPTSATGTFFNGPGAGLFDDQYTFSLLGGSQFIAIASATNVFPSPQDFILNFQGSVFLQVGAIGGGDDQLVLGPDTATANCGPNCQGFGGSALLGPGNYYLDISGFASGTSGYGGNLATAGIGAVPEPATWAMMLLGFIGVAGMGARKQWKGFRLA